MKIFLIGMPGSGKTTMGKQVAAALQLPLLDLDHEIEKRERKSIPEIFKLHGETHFRNIESALLKEWAENDQTFVMATGGGAPCFHSGIDVINRSGISIFIDVPVADLVSRVQHESGRPLLQNSQEESLMTKLERLRVTRLPFYRQATFILQNPSVADVLEKIKT
jgi:shikimate kinase